LGGIEDFIYDVSSSPDGATITAGGEDGILRIWQASDRKLLHAFSPPGAEPGETAAK
ncbi:MAG: NB-ARC domain protein, partial [Akkermansiaceae bacterium]|nr:NB-ARC domain protein [Akkermansiaceae bacterium]